MQTSVNLQPPFSYSIRYIVIILIAILGMTLLIYFRKNRKIPENYIEIDVSPKKNIKAIKLKYLKKLDIIEDRLNKNQITLRKAYQSLSSVIRYFAYSMTGIKVQNCTLDDIKKLNMPMLYELIKEYYRPEFAEKSLGDAKSSIEKTRKVIKKWS